MSRTPERLSTVQWKDLSKEQRVSLIKLHYRVGRSMAAIASSISQSIGSKVTRMSIVGIYTRNDKLRVSHPPNLPNNQRPKSIRAPSERKERPSGPPTKVTAKREAPPEIIGITPEEAAEYDAKCHTISIMGLTDRTCRWPFGDGPFLFCGCEVKKQSRYCAHHHIRAYPVPEPRTPVQPTAWRSRA